MSRDPASPRALIVALRSETDTVSFTQAWLGPHDARNSETVAEPAPQNDALSRLSLDDLRAVIEFAMSRTAFEPAEQSAYNAAKRARRAVQDAEQRLGGEEAS